MEAGIVDKAEDYIFSSARDYYGTNKGLLEVVLLETDELLKNIFL